MIYTFLMRMICSPGGLAFMAGAALVLAYKVGSWTGYSDGVAAQKELQTQANAEQREIIQERVRDVLDEIGATYDDDLIDSVLRGLATGNGTGGD